MSHGKADRVASEEHYYNMQVSTMMKPLPFGGCFTKSDATKTPWVFLGIADDTQSTYLHGPAEAPEAMRQALRRQLLQREGILGSAPCFFKRSERGRAASARSTRRSRPIHDLQESALGLSARVGDGRLYQTFSDVEERKREGRL